MQIGITGIKTWSPSDCHPQSCPHHGSWKNLHHGLMMLWLWKVGWPVFYASYMKMSFPVTLLRQLGVTSMIQLQGPGSTCTRESTNEPVYEMEQHIAEVHVFKFFAPSFETIFKIKRFYVDIAGKWPMFWVCRDFLLNFVLVNLLGHENRFWCEVF